MPAFVIKGVGDGEALVSYAGKKKGSYVYFFPPIQYNDGGFYIKIGHSPFDPLIRDLKGSTTRDKLHNWFNSQGDDVKKLQTKSIHFFKTTLDKLMPGVAFVEASSYSDPSLETLPHTQWSETSLVPRVGPT